MQYALISYDLQLILALMPVDGRVVHLDPTFEHEFFDVACAQGVVHAPFTPG